MSPYSTIKSEFVTIYLNSPNNSSSMILNLNKSAHSDPVADPGFPGRGTNPKGEGTNLVAQNCMKMADPKAVDFTEEEWNCL